MSYTIHTFGNADLLAGVFNAIAAIVPSSAFKSLIAIVIIAGFIGVLFALAFLKDLSVAPKYVLAIAILNSALLAPKVNIQLVDNFGQATPRVISNVPFGIAILASATTTIGKYLATTFETAFQASPADGTASSATHAYSKKGMLFGAKLIQDTTRASFSDPLFRTNLVNFIKNCTMFDLAQKRIDAATLATQTDLWPMMKNTNAARFSVFHTATTADSFTCPDVYTKLDVSMSVQVEGITKSLAAALYPEAQDANGANAAIAKTLLEQAITPAYTRAKIGGAASSAAQLIRQNALVNASREAVGLAGQSANDPSRILISNATAQATATLNAANFSLATIAQEGLPLMRNGIEAIAFSLFPLTMLIAMLSGGFAAFEIIKKYCLLLIWLSLWAPLYAVTNYLVEFEVFRKIAAASLDSGVTTGLTLASQSAIYSASINGAALAANFMLAVPIIASAVVFGMDKLMGLAQSASAGMSSATTKGSEALGTGNINQGNVSFDKVDLSASKVAPNLESNTNLAGKLTTDVGSGEIRYSADIGKNAMAMSSLESTRTSAMASSAIEHGRATQQARDYTESSSAALNNAVRAAQTIVSGSASSTGIQQNDSVGAAQQVQKLDGIKKQISKNFGLSDEASSAIVANVGIAVPVVKLGLQGGTNSSTKLSEAIAFADQAVKAENLGTSQDVMSRFAKTADYQRLAKSDNQFGTGLDASLSRMSSVRESASQSLAESERYSRIAAAASEFAASKNYDWTAQFNQYLRSDAQVSDIGRLSKEETDGHLSRFLESSEFRTNSDGRRELVYHAHSGPDQKSVLREGSFSAMSEMRGRYEDKSGEKTATDVADTHNSNARGVQTSRSAVAAKNGAPNISTETALKDKYTDMGLEANNTITQQNIRLHGQDKNNVTNADLAVVRANSTAASNWTVGASVVEKLAKEGSESAAGQRQNRQREQNINVKPDNGGKPPTVTPGVNPD